MVEPAISSAPRQNLSMLKYRGKPSKWLQCLEESRPHDGAVERAAKLFALHQCIVVPLTYMADHLSAYAIDGRIGTYKAQRSISARDNRHAFFQQSAAGAFRHGIQPSRVIIGILRASPTFRCIIEASYKLLQQQQQQHSIVPRRPVTLGRIRWGRNSPSCRQISLHR